MNDWTAVGLLFVLTAFVGALVWSVWRHRVVDDLHEIRRLLEQRVTWEHEIADRLRALAERGTPPSGQPGEPP